MPVGLAIAAGLAIAGGVAKAWGDSPKRKRAQRAQGLLAGKFRDSSWAGTRTDAILGKNTRASNVAGSQLEDDLSRAAAAGVNPTLLNEKRKAFMLAEAQKRAALGGNLEAAAVQATSARRAELKHTVDTTPSLTDSFLGGAGATAQTMANVVGASKGLDQFASPDGSFAPGEVNDLYGTGVAPFSGLETPEFRYR